MNTLSKLALVIATVVMLSPTAPAATLPTATVITAPAASSNLGPTAERHRHHRRRRHPRIEFNNAA
jgi:hypothetical protein